MHLVSQKAWVVPLQKSICDILLCHGAQIDSTTDMFGYPEVCPRVTYFRSKSTRAFRIVFRQLCATSHRSIHVHPWHKCVVTRNKKQTLSNNQVEFRLVLFYIKPCCWVRTMWNGHLHFSAHHFESFQALSFSKQKGYHRQQQQQEHSEQSWQLSKRSGGELDQFHCTINHFWCLHLTVPRQNRFPFSATSRHSQMCSNAASSCGALSSVACLNKLAKRKKMPLGFHPLDCKEFMWFWSPTLYLFSSQ